MYNDSFKSRYTTIPFATYAGDHCAIDKTKSTLSHCHREMELLLMLEGEAVFHIDGCDYAASAGDALIIGPYMLHATTFPRGTSCRHVCLCFDLSLLHDRSLSASLEGGECVVTACLSHSHPAAMRIGQEILQAFSAHASQEKGWEFVAVGSLCDIFGALLSHDLIVRVSPEAHRNDFCYRVFRYMEAHVGESVTSADAASALYMSQGHFCRRFRTSFGFSFGEYLTMLRMERAEHLLHDTDLGISLVAERVGFDSFSYFGKLFRKATGMSPTAYRKRAREEKK